VGQRQAGLVRERDEPLYGVYTALVAEVSVVVAAALHFGDPAFRALPVYFQQRLGPVLQVLLDAAVDAAAIRDGVDPLDLLGAAGKLCIPPLGTDDPSRANRMIALLIDGLRYGANDRRLPG